MKKFKVQIRGLSSLLQSKHPTPDEEAEITKRNSSGNKKMKKLTDEEQFEMHAYRNKEGLFVQPGEMIEAAMVKAAVNYKMEGKKTFKDVMKAGIVVDPVEIIHKNQDFTSLACWGKNASTGGAVWVVRPEIAEGWELEFTIDLIQDERVSAEQLEEFLRYAGFYVGIGAWRPKHGRFEIIKFEEITE